MPLVTATVSAPLPLPASNPWPFYLSKILYLSFMFRFSFSHSTGLRPVAFYGLGTIFFLSAHFPPPWCLLIEIGDSLCFQYFHLSYSQSFDPGLTAMFAVTYTREDLVQLGAILSAGLLTALSDLFSS